MINALSRQLKQAALKMTGPTAVEAEQARRELMVLEQVLLTLGDGTPQADRDRIAELQALLGLRFPGQL